MFRSPLVFLALIGCADPTMTIKLGDDTGSFVDSGDTDTDDTGPGPDDTSVKDVDGDGYAADVDCDDENDQIHPDAIEMCDGADNDCDGDIDEPDAQDATTYYTDADGDGYGDADSAVTSCGDDGYVDNADDCDDADDRIHPGADEADCTDPTDYNCDGTGGDIDADGDGYLGCQDCDDTEPYVNPGAVEICDPSDVDEDCNGSADADDPGVTDAISAYTDADNDGYGTGALVIACEIDGFSYTDGDCDDSDSSVNPAAYEECDELNVDEDCDGVAEESGAINETEWHPDVDSDGAGDRDYSYRSCDAPAGYVIGADDCDDEDGDVHVGATEYCNGIDDDCDYSTDEDDAADVSVFYSDADSDGFGDAVVFAYRCYAGDGYIADGTDCDDTSSSVNPGSTETCDGVDEDCDGTIDDDASDAPTWYADVDGDSCGDASVSVVQCAEPSGYVSNATDCDDADASVTSDTWYADNDEDGFGDADDSTESCDDPSTSEDVYVLDDTDCDDFDSVSYPGATEVEDGADNDCDGDVDRADLDLDSDGDGFADATGGNLIGDCASSGEEDGVGCTTGAAEYVTGAYEDQSGNEPTSVCGDDLSVSVGLEPITGDCALEYSVDSLTGTWSSEQWAATFESPVTAGADVWCYVSFGAVRTNGTLHFYVVNADTGSRIYPTSSSYENINLLAPYWITHEFEFNVGTATNIAFRTAMGDTSSSAYTFYVDGFVCQELL